MVTKDKYSLDPNAWCGLNRPDMPLEEADTVLFGIPFDGGASYRAGAAQAPARRSLADLRPGWRSRSSTCCLKRFPSSVSM